MCGFDDISVIGFSDYLGDMVRFLVNSSSQGPSKRALILEGFNVAQPLDKILGSIQERGLC